MCLVSLDFFRILNFWIQDVESLKCMFFPTTFYIFCSCSGVLRWLVGRMISVMVAPTVTKRRHLLEIPIYWITVNSRQSLVNTISDMRCPYTFWISSEILNFWMPDVEYWFGFSKILIQIHHTKIHYMFWIHLTKHMSGTIFLVSVICDF